MGQHNIEPYVFLNLLDDMSKLLRTDAFNGIVVLCEWLEEGDNTFTDSRLLATLVDIDCCRVEEEDLGVRELLFLWLLCLWLESWIDCES